MTPLKARREFLKQSTAAAAAAGLGWLGMDAAAWGEQPSGRAVDPAPELPIVDTHQHLWDLEKFDLPWLSGVPALKRSFLMADYRKATAGLGVVKTVYMEVDVHPSQQVREADYVIEICKRGDTPMAAAVISGRPAEPGFRDYIARYQDSPYIKGVRQVLHPPLVPRGLCLEPAFVRGVQLLGEMGMSFDLCMRNSELEDGAKLAAACPGTRFILDHCGNGDVQAKDRTPWRKGLAEVAKHKNVVCKVSGIVASAKPGAWKPQDLAPIIHYTIDQFGIDRVMFGGDWPVCTLAATFRQWVEALREVVSGLSAADQRKLFHDNAVAFYGLK